MKIWFFYFSLLFICTSCSKTEENKVDYKQAMRDFVIGISRYSKLKSNKPFYIIPQNGQEIITENGELNAPLSKEYIDAIDGVGREDLYYGYSEDNVMTSINDTEYLLSYLSKLKSENKAVFVIDYCSDKNKIDDAYAKNKAQSFISFASNDRNLSSIPNAIPYNENINTIKTLQDAKNFLFYINPQNLSTDEFIAQVAKTNYDIIIIDLFNNEVELRSEDIMKLKKKNNGGSRLVICYMSIGEAEDYRYYWKSAWKSTKPTWLEKENPSWAGNFKVKYWDKEWQDVIYGNNISYTQKIINAGFDGVYLDIIDAFEYFE